MPDTVRSLEVKDPNGSERIIVLTQDTVTIGRDPTCTITLHSPYVSRQHARIEMREEGCILVDLGSVNGASCNGTRVEGEVMLHPGDVITITEYTITCLGSAAAATTRQFIQHPREPREAESPDRLRVDVQLREVWIGDMRLERPLSAQEFDLLRYLYEHADRVCTRDELSDAIWGEGNWDRNMLHRLVHRLKSKVEPYPDKARYVQTVPYHGYRVTP